MKKRTQIILNRVPQEEIHKSLKDAKAEGKRLIRAWKRQDVILGINIQYKFV